VLGSWYLSKFGEDISKGSRVMAIYVFSKWRPLPSWIYFRCPFLSHNPFWMVAMNVSAKFHKGNSTGGWVLEFCQKFKMAALRHLELLLSNQCWTTHEVFLLTSILCSYFVSIESIVSKICSTKYFANLAYSLPINFRFGGFDPLNISLHHWDPQ